LLVANGIIVPLVIKKKKDLFRPEHFNVILVRRELIVEIGAKFAIEDKLLNFKLVP